MEAAASPPALAERLREVMVSAPLLGLLVAVTSWDVVFNGPSTGLDASWEAGLTMAVQQGLDFGDEIVFTYGPLGFLGLSYLRVWFGDLAVLTFIYTAVLYIGLCSTLVWALSRSIGRVAAALVTFVAVGILPGIEIPLLLTAAAAFAVLAPERHRYAVGGLVVGGSLFAAFESMIKLSVGPPIIVVCLAALLGARAGPRAIGAFLGLFVVDLVLLWLLSGQSLADLDDYVLNTREVISGYSEAMILTALPSWGQLAALALVIAFVAGAALGSYRDSVARWGAVAVAALVGFALFKEAVVRFDSGHLTILLSTIPVLWLVIPWERRRLPLAAAGAFALVATVLIGRPGGGYEYRLDPIDGVSTAVEQAEVLLDPSRRAGYTELARAFMLESYALDERTLSELEGQTVSIEPWEIAIAWAYDLDWSPLPVFQNYQAYTAELDELNAAELASAEGPERILRESQVPEDGRAAAVPAIDGRYPSWDPPAQALATLCNFAPLFDDGRWQVLGRVPERCGEPELIETVESSFGETVEVPDAGRGEVVFARIEGAEVDGLEKVRSLLFRAETRSALTDGGEYRLIPALAGNGLLLRGDPRLTGRAPFSQAPQTERITLAGVDGELTYEFFRMEVEG